ncbi:MAG: OadG family protein [Synergistetes bacterium]|nr:OadG family protein [Synergistota bacterium]
MHQLTGVEGSIIVSIIDFGLVFVILSILALIMYSFKFVFAGRKKKPEMVEITTKPPSASTVAKEAEEDEEVIAVIMAAITSYIGHMPQTFKVKRVTPSKIVSLWKLTARREAVGIEED